MKGIILAGGRGTNLFPLTRILSKQVLPIYDKPMIYYPLSVLMLSGISEILIISTPNDLNMYQDLLGDGSDLGLKLKYAEQKEPRGLAEAFIIGEKFLAGESVTLILGDNLYYGERLPAIVRSAIKNNRGATVFSYYVSSPERYGVIEFDQFGKVKNFLEKPQNPPSNYVLTGLYIYENSVVKIAKEIKPSARGELEITDINRFYLDNETIEVQKLGRGIAWLDTGTHDGLLEAAKFVQVVENRQGLKIGCIEEIAYRMQLIDLDDLKSLADDYPKSSYKSYLMKIACSNR